MQSIQPTYGIYMASSSCTADTQHPFTNDTSGNDDFQQNSLQCIRHAPHSLLSLTFTLDPELPSLTFPFGLERQGYMFRNAEYRIGLQQSLSKGALTSASDTPPRISGKISVKIGEGQEIQVDAESYVAELRREVTNLRDELLAVQENKEEVQTQDLLAYVQKLEQGEMQTLSG